MTNRKYDNEALVNKVQSIADVILKEKHSNCYRDNFFPLLIDKLNLKDGVEIGVDKGEFSLKLLSKSKLEKLYCVDTWQDDFGSDYRPGCYDKDGNKRYVEAINILGDYIRCGRAIPVRNSSVEAAAKFPDESLDFVYIDGDHSLAMLLDLYAWLPKVKIGGIVSGHDYKDDPSNCGIADYWGEQLPYQIKMATDYYCRRYGHKVNDVGGRIKSFWFVKNR